MYERASKRKTKFFNILERVGVCVYKSFSMYNFDAIKNHISLTFKLFVTIKWWFLNAKLLLHEKDGDYYFFLTVYTFIVTYQSFHWNPYLSRITNHSKENKIPLKFLRYLLSQIPNIWRKIEWTKYSNYSEKSLRVYAFEINAKKSELSLFYCH